MIAPARVYAPCGAAVATVGQAAPQAAAVAERVLAEVAAAVLREAAALEG